MRIWGGVLCAAAALLASEARANCAMPADYLPTEDPAGTVKIRLTNNAGRTCPDDGLLRRDVSAGSIVKITTCEGEAFLDECVPAGTYQYGLARPYTCEPYACGTAYFEEIAVIGAAADCVPTVAAPAAAEGVPWANGQREICSYQGPGHDSGCGVAPAGTVLGTNLALLLLGTVLWRWRAGRRARE